MTNTAQFQLTNPIHFLALGLGSGLLKPAPGTWGSLAALPILLLFNAWVATDSLAFIIICLFGFVFGVYLCGRTAKDIGVHDHSAIVWDEFVGIWLTFLFIPITWQTLLLGFLLFRAFDIVKPFPIRWLDAKVKGGFGIMIDDVIAGLFACAGLHLIGLVSVAPLA